MNYHKVYMNHVHSSSLLTQLATMWKSQTLCDAVIRTGNIITKAHRVVLVAACPMLQSMENATSGSHLEVRLASDIKQDSINTFLQYLYEGFMILTEENCKDVEKIARLLQVDGVIKCCLDFTKCLNASSSMQFKYSFHDQTEFKHVRVSELLKVQEKQHKRPSESSRPSSPGSKRQRILRASSPPLDTAMQVGAQKTHDTERMTESYKNNASDPWERVPRLGSQGASSQGANLQPGVIDIREDSLELIQTEPPKDSGGGRSQEPRKVQSSVSISVASQHNTNADLRVINVDGSNDSSSKTPVSTSSARGQITVSPLTMYHDSPTSSSSSVDSSRLPSERLPVSVPPSKPSSDHERQIPPSVNLSDFPTPSGDSLSHVKQRSSESFTTSTPHRAPYPVSLSAASRPAPSSQTKPFAAGSASQAGMSHSFTEGMPSSGPRSQQPPVSSSVGKSDGVEGSTTEKSSDISSKPKPDETPSTSDMTPDISIVKVEAGGDTDVPENLGGLDMYVTAGGVSVTSQQQARPPEDEEMDPADFDLEEPPGDWSRDEISNEGSSISGDQSGSWYTGQFKEFHVQKKMPFQMDPLSFLKNMQPRDAGNALFKNTGNKFAENESEKNPMQIIKYYRDEEKPAIAGFVPYTGDGPPPASFMPQIDDGPPKHRLVKIFFGKDTRNCKHCEMVGNRTPSRTVRTYYKCEACNVCLCRPQMRDCFFKYHALIGYKGPLGETPSMQRNVVDLF